jgi:CMD domain protein
MSERMPDIIDRLAAIAPGSHLDAIRARRPQAREHAQKSFSALFEPKDPGGVSARERFAVAAFVAGLHAEPATHEFYRSRLSAVADASIGAATAAEIARGRTQGPYGTWPAGPLSRENSVGLIYRVSDEGLRSLGARLAAAFEHAHLLVFRPRDADPAALQALLGAGWSTSAIVTLSQLVAFLSFQIRAVAGLRALAAAPAHASAIAVRDGEAP